jgi:EAL domain-containing protein (putative c-di-GMP-specific phosphodiesterase class I)/GGDEF domain-containing protein/PAS domain-containing protein
MLPDHPPRALRVLIDPTAVRDADGCVRSLVALGVQAEAGSRATADVDLVVSAAAPRDKGLATPWIAVLGDRDPSALAKAFDLGATAVLAPDAGVEEITQHIRFAVRDLERARVQERVTDLLERVERAAGVGSFEYEPQKRNLWLSHEARRLLGLTSTNGAELVEVVLARVAPTERRKLSDWLSLLGAGKAAQELECRLVDADGGSEWVRFCVPVSNDPNSARIVRGVVEEWSDTSGHDVRGSGVGGADFRLDSREFFCSLANAIERAESRDESVAIMVIDSDDLRSLATSLTRGNFGNLLHTLAVRVHSLLRELRGPQAGESMGEPLVLGRTSGGGLAVVVPGVGRRDDVGSIGLRLASWIGKPVHVAGRELSLACNIGIVCSALDCRDPEELVRRAETAAYCARREGRDRVKHYAPTMDAEAFERLSLEAALRRALARDEFVLHYQPRVEIRTGRIVGVEALVRWQHPDLGFVSPARFIPVAEETGLIVPLGAHVMRTACRQATRWRDAGLPPIRMSVNLSPLQLHDSGLLETIQECLRSTQLPADCLELELTEGALMKDPASDVELLRQIKSLGVHLSIDDFGTGYSSLAYLRRFPVDALKIDRSFLRDATSRPDDASIFSAIVLMGRSLKMTVVAEGVETPAQLSLLRVMRADEAQGFLLSPPVAAEQAAQLLAKGTLGQFAA